MTSPTQEVTRYAPQGRDIVAGSELMEPIDVDRMVAAVEAFHQFVGKILRPGVHYGKMPGVNKDFLWQPGAEEIFRAFNCRPVYETVKEIIDPANRYVLLWRKCRAVSIASGEIVGEADAMCTSDEFVTNCTYKAPKGDTMELVCPEHGQGRGREWDRGASLICTGKTAQAFERILPNALMKADKRAFVKCARTLGCASEFFTQDEDLVVGKKPGEGDEKAESSAPKLDVGVAWFVERDDKGKATYMVVCPEHGEHKATEWDRGATVKCTGILKPARGKDKPTYCNFGVGMETVLPERPQPKAKTEPEWVTTVRDVLAKAGHTPKDLELIGIEGGWKGVQGFLASLEGDGTETVEVDWAAVYKGLADQVTTAKAPVGSPARQDAPDGSPEASSSTAEPYEPSKEAQAAAIDPDDIPWED